VLFRSCTDCGACTQACPSAIDVPGLLMRSRSRVRQRAVPPEVSREVAERFAVSGNPQGVSLQPALESAVQSARRTTDRVGEVVYVPGCFVLHHEPELAADFLRCVSLFGREVAVTPASGACCGQPLWWAGELDAARAHAEAFRQQARGARQLVFHDPHCAAHVRERYPELGVVWDVEVYSGLELAAGMLSPEPEGVPRASREGGVVAAEVCRQRGAVGPRWVARLAGPNQRVATADCCGAAGLMPDVAPEVARQMGERWLAAVGPRPRETVMVSSPRCRFHLARLRPELSFEDPLRAWVRA
jgi:Fe-S oxidoreductase